MSLRAILLIGFICLIPACRTESELGVHLDLQQKRLANGLKIVLIRDPSLPSISYQTWIKAGSVNDPAGKSGLAHFFEHLYFKSAPISDLEKEGAEVSAATGRDNTVFYETVAPHLLPKVIELDAQRMKNLKYDEKDLHLEKAIALEERRLKIEESVEGKANEFIWGLTYRTHPYGNPILGHAHELVSIQLEDLQRFHRNYYQPNGAIIIVAGPIDFDSTFKKIEAHYGDLEGRVLPEMKIEPEPPQDGQRRLTLTSAGASSKLFIGIPISSASDDETFAVDILNNILFEGQSGRVYQSYVVNQPLFLAISGQSYTPHYRGLLTISAVLRSQTSTEQAEEAIESSLKNIAQNGVTQAEIQRATHQLILDLITGAQSAQGTAQLAGTIETLLGDIQKVESVLEGYAEVTPKQVQKLALKLSDRNLRSVVAVKKESAEP